MFGGRFKENGLRSTRHARVLLMAARDAQVSYNLTAPELTQWLPTKAFSLRIRSVPRQHSQQGMVAGAR